MFVAYGMKSPTMAPQNFRLHTPLGDLFLLSVNPGTSSNKQSTAGVMGMSFLRG